MSRQPNVERFVAALASLTRKERILLDTAFRYLRSRDGREQLAEVILGDGIRQIADEELLWHVGFALISDLARLQ